MMDRRGTSLCAPLDSRRLVLNAGAWQADLANDYLAGMAKLNVEAIRSVMLRRNYLFKHQVANLVGISYHRLTQILVDNESEVEEEIVTRLCTGLACERSEIVIDA